MRVNETKASELLKTAKSVEKISQLDNDNLHHSNGYSTIPPFPPFTARLHFLKIYSLPGLQHDFCFSGWVLRLPSGSLQIIHQRQSLCSISAVASQASGGSSLLWLLQHQLFRRFPWLFFPQCSYDSRASIHPRNSVIPQAPLRVQLP